MAGYTRLDTLTILDGSTFFVSDATGDVEAVRAEGFFHADMRHLSRWLLRVEGEQPLTLSSSPSTTTPPALRAPPASMPTPTLPHFR